MNPISSSDTLRKEIFIECSPETLFSYFTDPDKLVCWMGQQALLEPSIGGKYLIDVNGSDIAMGEYKEIIPNVKIVMTFGWKNSKLVPPGSSTLEFKLTPKGTGTLLELAHYDLPATEITPHQEGWTHYMARLKSLAQGQDPGVDPWSKQAMN